MQSLKRSQLASIQAAKPSLACGTNEVYPERIVQFGEGNFLRAFADWMVCELNAKGLFKGSILVSQPIQQGMAPQIQAQDGLYTVLARGVEKGKVVDDRRVCTSISRAVNPYEQWNELEKAFASPELRFQISNTTEAGIAYVEEAFTPGTCPASFPAKVANLLYVRFQAVKGDKKKGLIFLPCELIEKNGEKLRDTVLKHVAAWKLSADFANWIKTSNYFCNTLVDRIVPGYPRDEAAKITQEQGYEDKLLVAAEHFHLWVIEGPTFLAEEIPFHKIGLNVIWTEDMTPYRTRKVRVLNGAHTATVLAAYACGINTVREMVDDIFCGVLLRRVIYDEILPQVPLPDEEKKAYADSVVERFKNPFIRHELLSISLNSVSKWKVRVLPSLLDYQKNQGKLPKHLAFSLAALIWFYRGDPKTATETTGYRAGHAYPVRDDAPVLEFFAKAWDKARPMNRAHFDTLVDEILGQTSFWDMDLRTIPGLAQAVADGIELVAKNGMRFSIENVLFL